MITGFDDPELGPGVPLGDLASSSPPTFPALKGHWRTSAPAAAAACAAALLERGHSAAVPARVFLVPGRIEVLGKHTDYAGGRSLLAAVERGFTFVSVNRADARVRVVALDPGAEVEFPLAADLEAAAGWANYPMTVVRRVARDFPGIATGLDIATCSDLPPASGMSSSSALVIGTFLCFAGATGLAGSPAFRKVVADADELASYLAAVESGQRFGSLAGDSGVGTHGGSEDHTAILQARPGCLLQYRFVPAAQERIVPMPPGYRFAVAASGVEAEKTGAMRDRYNRASALARTIVEMWNGANASESGSLGNLLRSSPEALQRLRRVLRTAERPGFPARDLLDRLEHFRQESEVIIPSASSALAEGKIERFGTLVDESQRLAGDLLGNQTAETVHLARSARALGAAAASAFGAGYGGSVWAMVDESGCDEFLRAWRAEYIDTFPARARKASFFSSGAGPAAQRVA